jgi:hypothetical protein
MEVINMRHASIKRAEAEYQSAFELYSDIKKVQEILLSILMMIARNANSNMEKARDYEEKAWKVYNQGFNAHIFGLADVSSMTFEQWFDGARHELSDAESYQSRVLWINNCFDAATLAQIKVVKEKKAKLEFEKS